MFPSVLPLLSGQTLIDYLRGSRTVTAAEAAFAAWEVAGYALGLTLGQPRVIGSPPLTDSQLADAIEAHVARRGPAAGAAPWGLLLPLLLKLLERFL